MSVRDDIFLAMRHGVSEESANDTEMHFQCLGVYVGLALARIDPVLAVTLDRELRANWSNDPDNFGVAYGPEGMAKEIIDMMGRKGMNNGR